MSHGLFSLCVTFDLRAFKLTPVLAIGAAGSRPASAKRIAPSQAAAPAPKRQATKQEDEDVMDLLQVGHLFVVPHRPAFWQSVNALFLVPALGK